MDSALVFFVPVLTSHKDHVVVLFERMWEVQTEVHFLRTQHVPVFMCWLFALISSHEVPGPSTQLTKNTLSSQTLFLVLKRD